LNKKPQFRIKYYDYDDSELYTIIQIASHKSHAISDATVRLGKSSINFKIFEIEEINTPEYCLKEIKRVLTIACERNESSWLRKRKKKTMG
jgi:hypothetical protein